MLAIDDVSVPQEDWHWGTLTSSMAGMVDVWIHSYVGDARDGVLSSVPAIVPVPIPVLPPPALLQIVLVHPQAAVRDFLDHVISGGTTFVGTLVGQPAANRSVEPPPAPVNCRTP